MEEMHEILSIACLGPDMNPEPSEYEAEVLTTRPRRLVRYVSRAYVDNA
jgi:hypothetical protein